MTLLPSLPLQSVQTLPWKSSTHCSFLQPLPSLLEAPVLTSAFAIFAFTQLVFLPIMPLISFYTLPNVTAILLPVPDPGFGT